MKRKLVKQGAATMMVSLPSKWIKGHRLGKGDEVDIEETEKGLLLNAKSTTSKKKTVINLTNMTESSIRTLIVNAYRSGFDIVEMNFSDEKSLSIIKNTLADYIIGFEIMKQEKRSCIIENITEPSSDQFDVLLKKVFFNIKELIGITEQRLRNQKTFADYRSTVLNIHKFDNFCRRVISKEKRENEKLAWTFQHLIIHAQRELFHLNKFLDKNPMKASEEILGLLKRCDEMFELIFQAYVKNDITILEKAHEQEKKFIYTDGYNILSLKKGRENITAFHIMSSIRNFYLATSPLMGMLVKQT